MFKSPYYRFRYDDYTNCLYILKNLRVVGCGVHADYSSDDGKTWCQGGSFPFTNCKEFYAIKRLPRTKK